MEDDKMTITLLVAGDRFSITIRRSEEEYYRKAAVMTNNLQSSINKTYGDRIAADRLIKMVALNLALNLVKKEDVQDTLPIFDNLADLDKEVVELLNK